jgi:hypothetical protein
MNDGGSPGQGKTASHNSAVFDNWLNTAPKELILPFKADVALLMHLQKAISGCLEPVRKYQPHLTSPTTTAQAIFEEDPTVIWLSDAAAPL